MPLTILPTTLLHKARPSSPCFQCLGLSQNSLATAQDVEVYFSSPLPAISFFKMFSFGRKEMFACLSHCTIQVTPKKLSGVIFNILF